MVSKLMHLEFYFPEGKEKIKSRPQLANLIVQEMKKNNSISYSGYSDEKQLRDSIEDHLGDIGHAGYEVISEKQKEEVRKVVDETIDKCNKVLPIPVKNYVFVFPWSPTEEYNMFEGVIGVAPYSCVLHLFLSPKLWSPVALANSLAHELNHTIFYYYHYDKFNEYNLLDQLVMEGLAENFREQVVDPNSSSWSLALTEEEAFSLLDSIKDKLTSKDKTLTQNILFGSNEYKRWAGYSIGYWLVKKFIEQNKNLSWDEIMKKDSVDIFNSVIKK